MYKRQIYTSGSTGTPKGSGNMHLGMVNHLLWIQDILKLDSNDKLLQKTAVGMGVAVWEWMLPLTVGSRMIIAEPGGHKDPFYLQRLIDQHAVTFINFVPTMLSVFTDSLEEGNCSSLRHVVASGEALTGSVQQQVFQVLPNTALWDLYGPTEAADDVTYWRCLPEDGALTPPIGSPIWNTQLYICLLYTSPSPRD